MNRFFLFFRKIYLFILFVLLELAAITYYSQSSIYTNAKVVSVSDYLIRGVSGIINDGRMYINVAQNNSLLQNDIAELNNQIERYKTALIAMGDSTLIDPADSLITSNYQYYSARIVRNSVAKQHNLLTLDKGINQGFERDMSLIQHGSIVGYIVDCSENYSVAISILNTDFKSSGCDINDRYFGSILWDGVSTKYVTLAEIPDYSQIAVGDTIVTTEFSSRFPRGINIGTVTDIQRSSESNLEAKVELFLDMTNIKSVIAIKNRYLEERMALEENNIKE